MKYYYNGVALSKYCKKNNISYYSKLEKIYRLQRTNPTLSNDEIIRLVMENNIHGNSKYTYEGLSLEQYCQENSLNYHTIWTRISRLKKENQHTAINELIKIALDKHTKYMYEELSLWEYCKNNDINYRTILARINKFKNYYPDLENDELVQLSLKLKK